MIVNLDGGSEHRRLRPKRHAGANISQQVQHVTISAALDVQ
jgi:hypothetical protein